MQLITAPIDVVVAPLSTVVSKTRLNCATGQCQKWKGEKRGGRVLRGSVGTGHVPLWMDVSRRESQRFHYANLQLRLQLVDCGSTGPHRAMNEKFAENLSARLNCCCCSLQLAVVATAAALAAPAAMAMLCLAQRHRLNRYAPSCTWGTDADGRGN